jgi:hypothetical protein
MRAAVNCGLEALVVQWNAGKVNHFRSFYALSHRAASFSGVEDNVAAKHEARIAGSEIRKVQLVHFDFVGHRR